MLLCLLVVTGQKQNAMNLLTIQDPCMYDSGYVQQSSRIAICETSQRTVLHARTTDGGNLHPWISPQKKLFWACIEPNFLNFN